MTGMGLSYAELLADYQTKLNKLKSTEKEAKQRQGEVDRLKQQKEQASMELNSITRTTAAAREAFKKQREDLRSEQEKYLAENKLSWEKIKLVKAAIDSGFRGSGLSETEIKNLRNKIVATGSLTKAAKQLREEKKQLQDEIENLAVYQ